MDENTAHIIQAHCDRCRRETPHVLCDVESVETNCSSTPTTSLIKRRICNECGEENESETKVLWDA